MLRFLGGCLGRLAGLALIAAVLGVAWYNRHELVSLWAQVTHREPEVSAEVADAAAARLETLGAGADHVAFRAAELQSLVLYRWAPFLPEDVAAPRIGLGAGRITVEGAVPAERLGRIAELREVLGFLPDTATLRAVGSFIPLDADHVALEVHELGAVGIPIPKRLIPAIVARFRLDGSPATGPNAVAIPLPPAVGNVYVSGDSLVVSARRAGGE